MNQKYMFFWNYLASLDEIGRIQGGMAVDLSCFFGDPADAGNLISGSSAFSKSILNIWEFSVHILLKTCSENFERYFASV